MKKRTVTLFLVVIYICSMLIAPSSASSSKSVSEQADILNKLTILKGNGVDYNLEGQLSRSEAAAFIVRIMGKEKEVLENNAQYINTGFSDVPKNQWYAPYIGYCTKQGIIGGYPDGNYLPNKSISEKEFLKLVLGVLGYKYNADFNWENVCIAAYNNGLVLDYTYEIKKTDNNNYKRGEVVKVLYNSLSRPFKNTTLTILDSLINSGIITRSDAVSAGLKKDTVQTEISQIIVLNRNQIKIVFNEAISSLDKSQILIYETQNKTSVLSCSISSQTQNELIVSTSVQTPDLIYTVEIVNTVDEEGNAYDKIMGTFTGYKNLEVESSFFKIKKIEAINREIINVYFTQPINLNAELPMFYEILQGSDSIVKGSFGNMSVKLLKTVDNAVSLFLIDKSLNDGGEYTLKIDGSMTGTYGINLNDGHGDSMNFIANGSENDGFYITNVIPLYNSINKSYVQIDFNKELDVNTAQQWANYSVVDTNNIYKPVIGATSDGNQSVILTLSGTMDPDKTYLLSASNIKEKFKQVTVPKDNKYPFQGTSSAKDALSVANVSADDKGTLTVFFNRPLNPATAADVAYYFVEGVSKPTSVYFNSAEPYMARLYFAANSFAANNYTLKILPGMTDYLNDMNNTVVEFTFGGSSQDYVKPLMINAMIVGKDAIMVKTNREIASGAPNTMALNYKLEYKDENNNTVSTAPTSISYIDPTTLIMRFNSLDMGRSYTLRFVNSLTDYSGTISRLPSDGLDTVSVAPGY